MRRSALIVAAAGGVVAAAAGFLAVTRARDQGAPLRTVEHVDLQRYLGVWYEIASIPQRFQKGCTATTATYTLREDGDIQVLNQCRKGGLDGPLSQATGRAWVTDPQTNAKLMVQFFWLFRGAYWIIELGDEYEYAVVGHPSRDYLWILSRTPQLDDGVYSTLLERLRQTHGYDTSRLARTLQPS